jgi:hypothetical protein
MLVFLDLSYHVLYNCLQNLVGVDYGAYTRAAFDKGVTINRIVTIEWPDFKTTIRFTLLDEENPKQCGAFWDSLPFETVFADSMSGGQMFKIPLSVSLPPPAPAVKTVFFPEQPPGTLVSLGPALLLKYGKVTEPFRVPRIGLMSDVELVGLAKVSGSLREAYFFTKVINRALFQRG